MNTIKAVVRNGRIEHDEPIYLPDGTELTIPLPNTNDDERVETPEEIEAWIRWFDSLEPVEFTAAERAAWEAARKEQKEFELSKWEERSKQLEKIFP